MLNLTIKDEKYSNVGEIPDDATVNVSMNGRCMRVVSSLMKEYEKKKEKSRLKYAAKKAEHEERLKANPPYYPPQYIPKPKQIKDSVMVISAVQTPIAST